MITPSKIKSARNMSTNKTLVATVIAFSVLVSTSAYSETIETVKTKMTDKQLKKTDKDFLDKAFSQLSPLDRAQADNWRLSDKEWSRYKKLKSTSPRAVWTPNIDPITLLGTEARTDSERMKYAKLFNDLETSRTKDDIAFAFFQNKDIQKRAPEHNAFKSSREKRAIRKDKYLDNLARAESKQSEIEEFVVYVDLSKDCSGKCSQLLANKIETSVAHFYFINAKSDDELYQFLKEQSINGDKIKNGTYTLNYPETKPKPFKGAISIVTLGSIKNKGK